MPHHFRNMAAVEERRSGADAHATRLESLFLLLGGVARVRLMRIIWRVLTGWPCANVDRGQQRADPRERGRAARRGGGRVASILPVRLAAGETCTSLSSAFYVLTARCSTLQLRPLIVDAEWDVRVASSKCLAVVARSVAHGQRGAVADTFAAVSCEYKARPAVCLAPPLSSWKLCSWQQRWRGRRAGSCDGGRAPGRDGGCAAVA